MEAAKKGFSIDAAVKRSGSEPAGGSARKVVPKVSKTADENSCGTPSPPAPVSLRQGTSLGRMELEPAKRQNTPRAQTNAPVNIAVCPLGGGLCNVFVVACFSLLVTGWRGNAPALLLRVTLSHTGPCFGRQGTRSPMLPATCGLRFQTPNCGRSRPRFDGGGKVRDVRRLQKGEVCRRRERCPVRPRRTSVRPAFSYV